MSELDYRKEKDAPIISDYIENVDVSGLKSAVAAGKDVKGAIFELIDTLEERFIEEMDDDTFDIAPYMEMLDILLEKVDPNETTPDGETPLMYIAQSTNRDSTGDITGAFVSKLIKAGADINVQTADSMHVPLISVAILYDLPMVDILLKNGVDVNATDNIGNTALHYLVHDYSTSFTNERLKAILDLGMRDIPIDKVLNAQTSDGSTPILIAARSGTLEIAMTLLKLGASPQIRDESGKGMKDYINQEDHPDEYAALVEDAEAFEAAKTALENEKLPEFRKQFDELTNVNFRDITGDTLLHIAVVIPNVEAVKFLLKEKVDPTISNYAGKTAIDLITGTDAKSLEMKELLEPVGAPSTPPSQSPDAKYIVNAPEYPGFEIRTFRGVENNVIPVYVTTLPKGMLLFRGVSNISKVIEDLLGVEKGYGSGRFCLPPQYNVFAYPFPFVDETVGIFSSVVVYKLLRDVKVACFISPCPLSRADRSIKNMPIKPCDAISIYGCGLKGRNYDPCFDEKFANENPDIVGMIAIAGTDRTAFMNKLESDTEFRKYLNHYFSGYMDSHSLYPGIPEIILYPRTIRSAKDANIAIEPGTTYSDVIKLIRDKEDTAYVPEHIIPVRSRNALRLYLDTQVKNGNIKIDKSTGFFVATKHFLKPELLEDAENMAESFPELRFTRARFPWLSDESGSTATSGRGRRVTYRKRLQ